MNSINKATNYLYENVVNSYEFVLFNLSTFVFFPTAYIFCVYICYVNQTLFHFDAEILDMRIIYPFPECLYYIFAIYITTYICVFLMYLVNLLNYIHKINLIRNNMQ